MVKILNVRREIAAKPLVDVLTKSLATEVSTRVEPASDGSFDVVVVPNNPGLSDQKIAEMILTVLARRVCEVNRVYEAQQVASPRPF